MKLFFRNCVTTQSENAESGKHKLRCETQFPIDFYIIKLFLIHLVQKFAVFEFNWKRC